MKREQDEARGENPASPAAAVEGEAVAEEERGRLLARQALYRFTALALSDPRTGSFEALSDPGFQELTIGAAEWVRGDARFAADPLAPRERPLEMLDAARVFQKLPQSAAEFNHVYEQTFGLLVSGACPPQETDYIEGKLDFRRSQTLADVSGFYRAFGLKPSTRHPERHDHITLELEFMAFVLGLERQAQLPGEPKRAERRETCRRAQVRFLTEHLAWWAPAFAKVLSREAGGGYYPAVASFLAAWVPAERALLGVPVPDASASPEVSRDAAAVIPSAAGLPRPGGDPSGCEPCPLREGS